MVETMTPSGDEFQLPADVMFIRPLTSDRGEPSGSLWVMNPNFNDRDFLAISSIPFPLYTINNIMADYEQW